MSGVRFRDIFRTRGKLRLIGMGAVFINLFVLTPVILIWICGRSIGLW